MKIVFIGKIDRISNSFTIGKIYESIIIGDDYNPSHHFVKNDNGDIQWIENIYFIKLSQHRINQLKKLGI